MRDVDTWCIDQIFICTNPIQTVAYVVFGWIVAGNAFRFISDVKDFDKEASLWRLFLSCCLSSDSLYVGYGGRRSTKNSTSERRQLGQEYITQGVLLAFVPHDVPDSVR
ncbi:hypothetical protein C0J52_08575 [Blattella germanica]|nr:hypothetical protein C0J52_08575 [Blattella germanica]